MLKVKTIEKTTNNRFLNMYNFYGVDRNNHDITYFVASRAQNVEDLKVMNKDKADQADAIIIAAIIRETKQVVLIKQYRYSIDDYIYELPAGLVDQGESVIEAGKREMKEETGLDFEAVMGDKYSEKPFFTSVGLCDEACTTIYGYASGKVSLDLLEDAEDLEVVLADEAELRRILREEKVAQPAGYFIQSYLNSNGEPFNFLK